MNTNNKILVGILGALLLAVILVSASSYYSMRDLHEAMMDEGDFEEMHDAMFSGDFETAEAYHQRLDFECPMHELVEEGDISLDEFQMMHQWMTAGDFPSEKPEGLSDAAWELHMSHHPEIYK